MVVQLQKINWPGIGCVATAVVVIVASVVYSTPWWQLSIAQGLGHVDVSPLSFDAQLLGAPVNIPIIWFLTLSFTLLLLSAVVALFLSSIFPEAKYSKDLLNYAYKKPAMILVGLVILLFASTLGIKAFLSYDVPFVGTTTVAIAVQGVTLSVPFSAGFTWAFWLALLTATLAIGARFYQKRIITPEVAQTKQVQGASGVRVSEKTIVAPEAERTKPFRGASGPKASKKRIAAPKAEQTKPTRGAPGPRISKRNVKGNALPVDKEVTPRSEQGQGAVP